MKCRIGLLTSGGDCPGLNAAIRGVGKAAYASIPDVELVGIVDGYQGLINGDAHTMSEPEFSGILTQGGTILGTRRTPYKDMQVIGEDQVDKVKSMKDNYKKLGLDCLLTLGGNGTHKTANLLSQEGLRVIGLPKTIDNDIFGTAVTFGFHTAVDIATEVIDRIHTTADSHKRCMVVEMMGNKAGWLTLYSGIAGGADILILPEIPFSMDAICNAVAKRAGKGKLFSIIVVAEGAMSKAEAEMKKKERMQLRRDAGEITVTGRIAKGIESTLGFETRCVVPGHFLRGGSPSSYDRILATEFGVYAAKLIAGDVFGVTVAFKNGAVTHNKLSDIAGLTKLVSPEDQMVDIAKKMEVSFGE